MRGSWWIFVDVTTAVTSMASLTRKAPKQVLFCVFRLINWSCRCTSETSELFLRLQIGRRSRQPITAAGLWEIYR